MTMKYLIKSVHTWRVATVDDVENLHQELLEDNRFQVTTFRYKTKQIKVKGEVVEEYQVVTATLAFNEEKDPDTFVNIEYEVG